MVEVVAGVGDVIHPTEDDLEEYKRQDREERAQALREQQRDREPPIGDPCEAEGCVEGHIDCTHDQGCCEEGGCPGWECPCCQGTGVC